MHGKIHQNRKTKSKTRTQSLGNFVFFLLYQRLHARVPNHEVRRAGVFVHQEQLRSGLHRLHDGCPLRRAPARVVAREVGGRAPKRQIVQKRGNVHVGDTPAVFRSHLWLKNRARREDEKAAWGRKQKLKQQDIVTNTFFSHCLQFLRSHLHARTVIVSFAFAPI